MKKRLKIITVILFICLITTLNYFDVNAVFSDITIRFSNIGNTSSDPRGALPVLANSSTVVGKIENGRTMIKLTDLASKLGATISYNPNDVNEWRLSLDGQTVKFWNNSPNISSSISYSVINTATSQTVNYSLTLTGVSDMSSQIINGDKYVRLTTAAHQLGALIIGAESGEARVFDWRVNGSTPYNDSNTYIVGGAWISDWSTKGVTQLAPNFKINEFWDKSTSASNPTYYSQLKVSTKQLQCAQNIRYHYNNNSSLSIFRAFRSWYDNNQVEGWCKSFHMRGRAFDISTDSLYYSVYNEFKGTSSTPIDVSAYNAWRTRVTNGASGGYEIEKMPRNNSIWLHLQTQPQYDSAY